MEGLKYMRIQLQRCATLSVLGASNALVDAVFVTFGTHERNGSLVSLWPKNESLRLIP